MKVNINQELLDSTYSSPVEKKILEMVGTDISDEEKIKFLVEFLRGLKG